MRISKEDIRETGASKYLGNTVRYVVLHSGEVFFASADIGINIIGVSNPFNLTKAVDLRCKVEVVVSFDSSINPQRYILVDIYGLMCMVFRSRSCKVNAMDFIEWAEQLGA